MFGPRKRVPPGSMNPERDAQIYEDWAGGRSRGGLSKADVARRYGISRPRVVVIIRREQRRRGEAW